MHLDYSSPARSFVGADASPGLARALHNHSTLRMPRSRQSSTQINHVPLSRLIAGWKTEVFTSSRNGSTGKKRSIYEYSFVVACALPEEFAVGIQVFPLVSVQAVVFY